MADAKITDLTAATLPLTGTELVEAVQGGLNVKVPASAFGTDLTNPSVAQTWVDDFLFLSTETGEIGALGWSITNGTIAGISAGVAGRPGVIRRTSGGTANQVASLYPGAATSVAQLTIGDTDTLTWIVGTPQTGSDFTMRVGYMDNAGTATTPVGFYIERLSTDTNWFGVVRSATTTTRADLGVGITTDGWYKLVMRRVASADHRFSINGGTEVSITNPSVPASSQGVIPAVQIIPTTTTSRIIDIDFVSARNKAISR